MGINILKLIDYLEMAVASNIEDIKDTSNYTIIIFDLETSGLIGSQGLKLLTGEKRKNPETGKDENVYSSNSLHIAEIGAISYSFDTKKRGKFHTFIKAKLSDKIKELISWSDVKEQSAKDIRSELKSFETWLNKFPKKIIVAHNGEAFDFKIMRLIAEKFGMESLANTFTVNSDDSTILVDTKKTTNLRKQLKDLPWPIKKDGKESNTQNDLITMFGINNINAHTAIEDVRALAKYLIKLKKEIVKKEI